MNEMHSFLLVATVLRRKVKILFLINICIAACFFAMQCMLSPTLNRIAGYTRSTSVSSYSIDFSQRALTDDESKRLYGILDGSVRISKPLDSGYVMTFSDSFPAVFGFCRGGGNRWYVQAEGRYFTKEEEENGSYVCILSEKLYPYADFEYSLHPITIQSRDFEIVGLGSFNSARFLFMGKENLYERIAPAEKLVGQIDFSNHATDTTLREHYDYISQAIFIPYSSYREINLEPDVANLAYADLNTGERNQIVSELEELFPGREITKPSISNVSATKGTV